MRGTIKNELLKLKDDKYKDFSLKLLPGVSRDTVIGVRIPLLRKMAFKIAKGGDWEEYIYLEEDLHFEEKMIQGMIIGNVNAASVRKLELINLFLPRIDNWSVCDSFCSGLKFAGAGENRQLVWEFIDPLFNNSGEYYVRFAAVMALNYYTDNEYISSVLNKYSSVKHEGYYAQMAVSWGIAEAFAKNPVFTTEFIKDNYIDNFTYNKALQKIRESFRVKKEDKDMLKNLILG